MEGDLMGWRLAAAMEDLGVSVNELCRRTGLSRRTVVRMRSGDPCNIRSWELAAHALGMSLSELLSYGS